MRSFGEPFVAASFAMIVASSNQNFRDLVENRLREQNVAIEFAGGGAQALCRLEDEPRDALLLDRALPDLDVHEVKRMVAARYPSVKVWILHFESGRIRFEADEQSPSQPQELWPLMEGYRQPWHRIAEPAPECSVLANGQAVPEVLPGIVGDSPAILRVEALIRLVAPRSTVVLLTGETGTGKELAAKAIHQLSPRAKRPFAVVHCAAIPESLFESELFGYRRGAFTGAVESWLGRIHAANGGTLFLDEVGELPLAMQAKLLRFLQEGEVQRLGCHDPCNVDTRVIAATNADLETLVAKGRFRKDLFYRLAVFPIELQPLRERREDIGLLARRFLNSFCDGAGTPRKDLSSSALLLLRTHPWPGNVRELKHAIERGFIFSGQDAVLLPEHFSFLLRRARLVEGFSQTELIFSR